MKRRAVDVQRLGPQVTLFDAHLGDYRELFFVVSGDKSVTVTMFDESDASHREAQVFVFARPYGWDLSGDDEEALLQVWQAVGVQR